MRSFQERCGIAALFTLLAAGLPLFAQSTSTRTVAFTIDDLPAGAAHTMTAKDILEMTAKLLGALREQQVPAVGFVNEEKLYKMGEVDDRIQALNLWLWRLRTWKSHLCPHFPESRSAAGLGRRCYTRRDCDPDASGPT